MIPVSVFFWFLFSHSSFLVSDELPCKYRLRTDALFWFWLGISRRIAYHPSFLVLFTSSFTLSCDTLFPV